MKQPICKNCFLYDGNKGICKVAVLIDGKTLNLPVFPDDACHMDQLGIPVEQVRWFQDEKDNKVKIEYPEGFFGKEQ